WGDARAYDGTISLIQPLIAPLYQRKSSYELLAVLLGQASPSNYEIVHKFWQTQWPQSDFEKTWNRALQKGMVEGTALPAKTVKLINDVLNSVSKVQSEARCGSGL